MKMLSDYELFKQLSEKRRIQVPPDILEAMKAVGTTGALRLPCQSIVLPLCEILGRVLSSSSTIRSIDFGDCMLVSKGLSKILDALSEGTNITSINLKGNNIGGSIVSQMGEIFQRNNTLKCLNIEWNNLGTDTVCFEKFCDGLAVNHSIQDLDLRYNQISPFCAEALANVIRRNKSIKYLNLSRNSLGGQGGQMISSAMKENKSIIKLHLGGNCIPEEILAIVDDLTYKNQSRELRCLSNVTKHIQSNKVVIIHETPRKTNSSNEEIINEDLMTKKKIEKHRKRLSGWRAESTPYKNYQEKSDSSQEEISDSELSLNIIGEKLKISESGNATFLNKIMDERETGVTSKISELNQILQERKTVINNLTADIAAKDNEIAATTLLVNQLQSEISQLKMDNDKLLGEKLKEIEEMKKDERVHEENWKKMQMNLEQNHNNAQLKTQEVEARLKRYETDIHRSSVTIVALREKLVSKTHQYEEIISNHKTEIHRLKTELRERVNRYKMDVNILKDTLKETTDALEDCQTHLQKTRVELREVNENFSSAKSKLNDYENVAVKYLRLDETFLKLKEEKSLLEDKLVEAHRTISSLKRQMASLESELIEPQCRYNLLKEELEQEKQKSTRLKEDLNEERLRLKEQDNQLQKMSQQITSLNTQIADAQKAHTEEIKERDKEKKQLKEIITNKDRNLSDLKADEAQRAGQLYAAFSKYLGSIGTTTL